MFIYHFESYNLKRLRSVVMMNLFEEMNVISANIRDSVSFDAIVH